VQIVGDHDCRRWPEGGVLTVRYPRRGVIVRLSPMFSVSLALLILTAPSNSYLNGPQLGSTLGLLDIGVQGSPFLGEFQRSDSGSAVIANVSTLPVGIGPSGITVDSATGEAYVANQVSKNVSVIEGTSVEATIGLPLAPTALAYDPSDGFVYVGTENVCSQSCPSDNVTVLNGTAVLGEITVGTKPAGIAFDPDNGYIYVASFAMTSNNVSVIDGLRVVASVNVSSASPTAVVYDPADGFVYVTDYNSGSVTVIDGTLVVATIPVNQVPCGATYDAADQEVFVANLNSADVSLISGTKVVGTIPVGSSPCGAAFDPVNGDVYVTDIDSNAVSILNATSVVAQVPVGTKPIGAAFDAINGFVYITNQGSNDVTVLNGSVDYRIPGSPAGGSSPAPPIGLPLVGLVIAVVGVWGAALALVIRSRRRRTPRQTRLSDFPKRPPED
jgi:YVTN family beta-propeller protein